MTTNEERDQQEGIAPEEQQQHARTHRVAWTAG